MYSLARCAQYLASLAVNFHSRLSALMQNVHSTICSQSEPMSHGRSYCQRKIRLSKDLADILCMLTMATPSSRSLMPC